MRRSLCAPCQKKSSGFAQISEKGGITFEWNRGTRTNHTSCTRALCRSLSFSDGRFRGNDTVW